MSTLKVNKIENTATTNGGVQIDVDGHVTIDGQQLPTAGPLSNRNLIINGAMQVAQRGTSKSGVNTNGYHTIDRMRLSTASLVTAQFTHEQVTDAPADFSHSLKVTTTTAEGSVGSDDAYRPLQYNIEGQDLQHLEYGTANAKTLTLSFYVKSSVTGTYSVAFYRDDSSQRQITSTYTVNAANTWEYKTITIPGDTGAGITSDNANRLSIYWHAGSGSDYTSTDSTSWENYTDSGFAFGNAVNLQNTLNATWQITGVQLEVGTKSTPFEHESYGQTLAKCQRYFEKLTVTKYPMFPAGNNGVNNETRVPFHVQKRANPTVSKSGNMTLFLNGVSSVNTDHSFNGTLYGAGLFAVIAGANYSSSTGINSATLLADAEL